MKKFLKISFTVLALLLCTQSWAGDDPKGKGKPAEKSINGEIKTSKIVVSGDYDGMTCNNGSCTIKCLYNPQAICFIVPNAWWVMIPATGETIEVKAYLGSEEYKGYTNHYFTVHQ
jgi:hypothetical protein